MGDAMNTIENRMARLYAGMQAEHMQAIAVVPGANLTYLSGLSFHHTTRVTLLLLSAHNDTPLLVVPALEHGRVAHGANLAVHCYAWDDVEGPKHALLTAIEQVGLDVSGAGNVRIGVEYTAMRVFELRALEYACNTMFSHTPSVHADIVDASPLFGRMRMVKDADELAAMEQAVRIIETALDATIAHIQPGITELQVADIWKKEIKTAGAEDESFPCIVASGPNGANPHHSATDRALQPGDLIILDGGARYTGYVSDITRTVALGTPDAHACKMYDAVREANAKGRAVAAPGMCGEEIDKAVRTVIRDAGYGEYFMHRTGHGLGLECHEPPSIVADSREQLPVGATFTIEPGVYVKGIGGVRIEDDVVLTEDGCRSLTTFPRELMVIAV